jgi:hypothetical protein
MTKVYVSRDKAIGSGYNFDEAATRSTSGEGLAFCLFNDKQEMDRSDNRHSVGSHKWITCSTI